jgi:hypothetical protein
MNKVLNWGIALLLPSLICCGSGKKTQDVPEEIYACPMPGEPGWDDEPIQNDTIIVTNDTTTNKIN